MDIQESFEQQQRTTLTPLHEAISNADELSGITAVRHLITNCHADVNERCGQQLFTPLHCAAFYNKIKIVELLLSIPDVLVNATDKHGCTPFYYAVGKERENIVQLFLDNRRVDINVANNFQKSPFLAAVASGNLSILNLLLARKDLNRNQRNADGETASHIACQRGRPEVILLLAKKGCFSLHAKDNLNATPILHAIKEEHVNIIELAISEWDFRWLPGCKPNGVMDNDQILSILASAAMKGSTSIVEVLVRSAIAYFDYYTLKAELVSALEQSILKSFDKTSTILVEQLQRLITPCDLDLTHHLVQLAMLNHSKKTLRRVVDLWDRAYKLYIGVMTANVFSHNGFILTPFILKYAFHKVELSRIGQYYIKIFKIEDTVGFPTTGHILYHAIRLGLVQHVRFFLDVAPKIKIDLLTQNTIYGIKLFELAAKSDRIFSMLVRKFGMPSTKVQKSIIQFETWHRRVASFVSTLASTGDQAVLDTSESPFRPVETIDFIRKHIHHTPKEECNLVFEEIHRFINEVAEKIGMQSQLYFFRPVLAGSGKEGTRPFQPDEFDFILVFDEIIKFFHIRGGQTGLHFVMEPKTEAYTNSEIKRFVQNGRFDVAAFVNRVDDVLESAIKKLFNPKFGKYLIIEPNFYQRKRIPCITLIWRGEHLKNMEISIDLVAAFELESATGLKPLIHRRVRLNGSEKFYLFIKFLRDKESDEMPIAFSDIEVRLIKSLPPFMKMGYILAKAMRNADLFPVDIRTLLGIDVHSIDDCLKTYMLKCCTLYLTMSNKCKSQYIEPTITSVEWARLIYKTLEFTLVQNGIIPSFFTVKDDDPRNAIVVCSDPMDIDEANMRACCIKRKNLIIITRWIINLLDHYMVTKTGKIGETTPSPGYLDRIVVDFMWSQTNKEPSRFLAYERCTEKRVFELPRTQRIRNLANKIKTLFSKI